MIELDYYNGIVLKGENLTDIKNAIKREQAKPKICVDCGNILIKGEIDYKSIITPCCNKCWDDRLGLNCL